MPKRKRSDASSLQDILERSQTDVFRALKLSKGFERQGQNKRLKAPDATAEKKQRIQREISVLKTARAHLFASLLKVKAIAASTDLPDEIRTGVPKPELSEEERSALHNVTSGLYNQKHVREAIDGAVRAVCDALDVPPPEKAKRVRKSKGSEQEESPADLEASSSKGKKEEVQTSSQGYVPEDEELEGDEEDVTDFEGFESDVDPNAVEADAADVSDEETAFSKLDHLLGEPSDSDDDSVDETAWARYKGTEKVNLDDISISGSGESSGSESDVNTDSDSDADSIPDTKRSSRASSSLAANRKTKSSSKTAKKMAPAPVRDSTFLPSLMGGYISGSESASDVDVAPAKKRRGQKARQAIWEKKYGEKAKHLQQQQQGKKGGKGRDAGWDMRRGAVDGEDAAKRTPWKKGSENPLMRKSAQETRDRQQAPDFASGSNSVKRQSKDDQGILHPSWEARKKAKDSQKAASFAGTKVTFD